MKGLFIVARVIALPNCDITLKLLLLPAKQLAGRVFP